MTRSRAALLFSAVLLVVCHGRAGAQVRLGSGEAERLAVERPEPAYPPIAKAVRAEGVVKVEATVSEAGAVTSARAVSGHPLLQSAAVAAVKRHRYRPHTVGGQPVAFVTEVYVRFPPGPPLTGAQKDDYERQDRLARQYFREDDKCREMVRAERWPEAEAACGAVVRIAEQLSADRSLEKMGAYEMFGHVRRGQRRYREALEYYARAHDAVRSELTEKNAELGRLYGNLAITHHLLRDLGKARELYKEAERVYRTAHAAMAEDDPDAENDRVLQGYVRALKQLLEFHLIAAEAAGAAAEAEEVKRQLESLP